MGELRELSRPPGLQGARRAIELLRVWHVDEHQHLVMKTEVLARIRQGFDAEWESPTDEP